MYWAGIDVGNTRTKYYLIENGIVHPKIYTFDEMPWEKITKAAIVRTGKIPPQLDALLQKAPFKVVNVSRNLNLPFKNLYRSPGLGADRIALVAGAEDLYGDNVLVIDAGSCITYDYLDKEKNYRGGAISPGIRMRYKALSSFTADLPHLDVPHKTPPLTGNDTQGAIHSGVVNGTLHEIEGFIRAYNRQYPGVKTVLTGGDASFLSVSLKIKIFAIQKYLLAQGLKKILQLN